MADTVTNNALNRSGDMQGPGVVRKAEDALLGSLAARKDECMRIRQAARIALEENRRRRRAMAEEVRQQLRTYRARILSSLAPVRRSSASAPEAVDDVASAQFAAAAALHKSANEVSAGSEETAPILNVGNVNSPETLAPSEERVDAAHVLGVIRAHREGIALTDIGNELGVDWRVLIGIVRGLLDDGQIEQIQRLLYPVTE